MAPSLMDSMVTDSPGAISPCQASVPSTTQNVVILLQSYNHVSMVSQGVDIKPVCAQLYHLVDPPTDSRDCSEYQLFLHFSMLPTLLLSSNLEYSAINITIVILLFSYH